MFDALDSAVKILLKITFITSDSVNCGQNVTSRDQKQLFWLFVLGLAKNFCLGRVTQPSTTLYPGPNNVLGPMQTQLCVTTYVQRTRSGTFGSTGSVYKRRSCIRFLCHSLLDPAQGSRISSTMAQTRLTMLLLLLAVAAALCQGEDI